MSLHVKYFAVTLAVHSPSWRQWASSYSLQPKLPPALVLNSTSVTEATGRLSQDSNIPSSGLCGYAVCRPLSVHDWHSCLCVQEKKKKKMQLFLRGLWHIQYCCVNCQTIMTGSLPWMDEWGWKAVCDRGTSQMPAIVRDMMTDIDTQKASSLPQRMDN